LLSAGSDRVSSILFLKSSIVTCSVSRSRASL
jgi:hypothetical protein